MISSCFKNWAARL